MPILQVIYDGEVILEDEIEEQDAEYVEALEAANAALSDQLEEAHQKIAMYEDLSDEVEALASVFMAEDEVDPDTDTVTYIAPSVSIQDVIDAAQPGDVLQLISGVYHQQIDLSGKQDITIRGFAVIDGRKAAEWEWIQEGDLWTGPWLPHADLWHHTDPANAHNSEKQYPVLATIEDDPLLWDSELSEPGTFHINAPADSAGQITVRLKEGQNIANFLYSPFPWLLIGDENTEGITLENIQFVGCSNTGFTGAVNFPGAGWTVKDVTVSLANTIGIELGQGGEKSNMRSQVGESTFENVHAVRSGQLGWWGSAIDCEFIDCVHTGSNWKGSDTHWHASHKLENTHDCSFIRWQSIDNGGPGFWFDGVYVDGEGGNTGNYFEDLYIMGAVRTGLELELGTSSNTFNNTTIKGVQNLPSPNPEVTWSQSAGIMVKGSSDANVISGAVISECEKAVWIDNTDARGPSKDNTFTDISTENVEQDYMLLGEEHGNSVEIV